MPSEELENLKTRLAKVEREVQELKTILQGLESPHPTLESLPETKTKPSLFQTLFGFRESFEKLMGANLIGKAGFLAIILAFIWFLGYAFENYWINESGRIILAILGGYFFWGLSLYFYTKHYKRLSPAMLGTGITIVLLGIFSAYRFYDFFTIQESFIYILVLSVVTVFFSRISQSEALYVFGAIIFFLNPILLSTGENSYKFLFTYLTLWNLVHIWMGKKFYWKFSSLFIPILNTSLYGIWMDRELHHSSFLIPFLFLLLSFIGLFIRELYFQLKLSSQFHWVSLVSVILGITGYTSLIQITTNHFYPQFTPALLMFLALIPLSFMIYLSSKVEFEKLLEISGIVVLGSSYLFVVATLSLWKDEWYNLSFLLTSFGITTLGARQNKKFLYYIGLLLWIFTLLSLVFVLSSAPTIGKFLFNTRFLIYIFGILSLYFTYRLIPKNFELPFKSLLYFSTIFILIFATMVEVYHYVQSPSYRNLAYSYVFVFYSALFLSYGFMKNSLESRKLGLLLITLLIVKFYLYDIWKLSLIVKIISGFSLGIGLVIVGIFYEKFKTKILGEKE